MKNKFIPISAIFAICFSLTGCNQTNDNGNNNSSATVLNVYNCADYINEDVLTEFEEYCLNTLNKKGIIHNWFNKFFCDFVILCFCDKIKILLWLKKCLVTKNTKHFFYNSFFSIIILQYYYKKGLKWS